MTQKLFLRTVIRLPILHTITKCPSVHEIVFALGLDLKPKDACLHLGGCWFYGLAFFSYAGVASVSLG
ncbi:hypothetical protein TSUD_277230 [Trifolium subterraneum]|uniref:Uncharacterized protein n=1 Tax=Trifolium subterraneum TaxID=3900 RepID=A0A2Z6MXF6_TRISU|nr:hypothetical protein TSUD_277230 [Trifolium subterraneum]